MNEQSHKDEMAAALRGDFARLRARGVESTLTAESEPEEPQAPRDEAPPTPVVDERRTWLERLRGRA